MIYVSYDKIKRRLIVECSYNDNHVVKLFPSRKFNPKHKHWQVTMCRKNVEYLDKIAHKCEIDDAAKAAISIHQEKTAIPPPKPFPVSFPFKTSPFDHQREALKLSWNREHFAYFMEMGTGKSKVATDKASCHFFNGDINGLMIFCPVSIRTNWVEELRVHCPVDLAWKKNKEGVWLSPFVKVADFGTTLKKRDLDEFIGLQAPFKILIVGMESLSQGSAVDDSKKAGQAYALAERFARAHNHMQVVDEGHNIKSHDSNRTENIVQLGHYAKYKVLMTGTPILQGLLDLYAYFEYLDPNVIGLGDWFSFRARYAILSEDGYNRVVAYDNVEELLSAVQPHIYQVTKKECLDLPEKIYQTREVQLTAAQKGVYSAIKKHKLYEKGDVNVVIDNALQKYSALQTIVGGFINYDKREVGDFVPPGLDQKVKRDTLPIVDWKGNPKVKELLHCLDEIGDKEQAIIWAVHTYEIKQICEALRHKYGKTCVAEYYGGVSLDERDEHKRGFNSGKYRFFVGNQAAGGVGLTLNEAAFVFYMSNSFKLKDRLQSEDRNHRIGQTRNVLYTTIIAAETVDVDIMAAVRDKKDFADWVKDQFADGHRQQLSIFGD